MLGGGCLIGFYSPSAAGHSAAFRAAGFGQMAGIGKIAMIRIGGLFGRSD